MGSRFVVVAAAVFALLGTGLLWAGLRWHASADALLRDGQQAVARVVALRTEQRFSDSDPSGDTVQGQAHRATRDRRLAAYEVDVPTLRFVTARGVAVEVDGPVQQPGSLPLGSEVPVHYRAEDPQGARASAELQHPVAAYALWTFGLALWLPALLLMVQAVRRRLKGRRQPG